MGQAGSNVMALLSSARRTSEMSTIEEAKGGTKGRKGLGKGARGYVVYVLVLTMSVAHCVCCAGTNIV